MSSLMKDITLTAGECNLLQVTLAQDTTQCPFWRQPIASPLMAKMTRQADNYTKGSINLTFFYIKKLTSIEGPFRKLQISAI